MCATDDLGISPVSWGSGMAIRVGCQAWDEGTVSGACHLSFGNQRSTIEQKRGMSKLVSTYKVSPSCNSENQRVSFVLLNMTFKLFAIQPIHLGSLTLQPAGSLDSLTEPLSVNLMLQVTLFTSSPATWVKLR